MTTVWRPLACEGCTLVELRFVGNGKDSEVTIRTEEYPEVVVPLSGAAWDVSSAIPLATAMRAHGDLAVQLVMRPADGASATVSEARVDDWSGEDELPTIAVGSRLEVGLCAALRVMITRP